MHLPQLTVRQSLNLTGILGLLATLAFDLWRGLSLQDAFFEGFGLFRLVLILINLWGMRVR